MAAPKANNVADDPVSYGEVAVAGGTLPICMAGEGAPVILLHGWTLDHRMWAPQVAGLADDFFLVMPDRRGCGRATAPPDLMKTLSQLPISSGSSGSRWSACHAARWSRWMWRGGTARG